jgi:signal transduction histidine kinase
MLMADDSSLLEREQLATLASTISHLLTAQESVTVVLQRCAEQIVAHLDVVFARIWLLDNPDTLVLKASAGLYTNLQGRYSRVPVSASLKIGRMVLDRRPRLTNKLAEEGWVKEPEWAQRERLVAYAGYPLIAKDRVVGVMAMFSRHPLTERTLEELAAISGGIAQCVVRCQAEQALLTSEERLSLAVEGAAIAFWDWDVATGKMIWSDRFYTLMGDDPVTTRPTFEAWQQRIHPEDLQRVTDVLDDSRHNGTAYSCDYRVCPTDGSDPRWVAARGRFLTNGSGTVVRMIGALSDIGHRKQAEAEVRHLLDQAERRELILREKQAQLVQSAKLASIGQLTTGVAHELNNPLNNIGLFVGNALELLRLGNLQAQAKAISDLEAAQDQIKRAADMIHHLRMFSRAPEARYRPVAVNEVVLAAFQFVREKLRLADVAASHCLAPEKPSVYGCRIQLEQVMVNLISNAADAMQDTETKVLAVATIVTADSVEIAVRDSGVGIPTDVLPNIFDPFFTTKEVGAGTGLGLSITYGIVKEHHGDIRVESDMGRGTEFRVQLPLLRIA